MKKEFNLSLFLGCCLIAVSIVAAGWMVSRAIPDAQTTVSITEKAYLTPEEAADFCGLEVEDLQAFSEAPNLTAVINGKTVYWKAALIECMNSQFVK